MNVNLSYLQLFGLTCRASEASSTVKIVRVIFQPTPFDEYMHMWCQWTHTDPLMFQNPIISCFEFFIESDGLLKQKKNEVTVEVLRIDQQLTDCVKLATV